MQHKHTRKEQESSSQASLPLKVVGQGLKHTNNHIISNDNKENKNQVSTVNTNTIISTSATQILLPITKQESKEHN